MVEIEAHVSEPKKEEESVTNIDVTEIIDKVRQLVGNVKEMAGKPVDVKMESFNFNFSKAADGEYGLSVDTRITVKPK